MSRPDRLRVVFEDLNARQATNLVRIANGLTDPQKQTGANAFINCSMAHRVTATVETDLFDVSVAPGAAGDYATAQDMATMLFRTAGAETAEVTIVAPKGEIFLADDKTVDAANVNVSGLIDWLILNGKTVNGAALTEFVRGWRWFLNS